MPQLTAQDVVLFAQTLNHSQQLTKHGTAGWHLSHPAADFRTGPFVRNTVHRHRGTPNQQLGGGGWWGPDGPNFD